MHTTRMIAVTTVLVAGAAIVAGPRFQSSAVAQSNVTPTPTSPPLRGTPVAFPLSRHVVTSRASKIVTNAVKASQDIICHDSDADTQWFDRTPACTLSSMKMPLRPTSIGYMEQPGGSGPWYSDSQIGTLHMRWNNGRLELLSGGTGEFPQMSKGTTVTYYGVVPQKAP